MKIEHTERAATHAFWVVSSAVHYGDAFVAEYRPLHPKTGEPWQASHRIEHGADVSLPSWGGRLVAYSTVERARAAIEWQAARLTKRRAA